MVDRQNIITAKGMDELAKNAAMMVFSEIIKVLKEKDYAVVALPGGRSVKELYSKFKDMYFDYWNKVHIFLVDDRMVEMDSSESNSKMIKESFAQKLIDEGKLPLGNVHYFSASGKGSEAVKDYNNEFKRFGGKFDIVVLGAGEDGHVAALFPNHHSIMNESNNYFSFDDSPKMPASRMTSSRKMIINSGMAMLFFIGAGKKTAMNMYLDENIDFEDLPARLADYAGKTFMLADMEVEENIVNKENKSEIENK